MPAARKLSSTLSDTPDCSQIYPLIVHTDRYKRLLYDVLAQTCGEEFVEPPTADSRGAYIAPAEATYVDPVPAKSVLNNLRPLEAGAALGVAS